MSDAQPHSDKADSKSTRSALNGSTPPPVTRADLSAASGIVDAELVGELMAHGVTTETLSALALIPLVQIAWADGALADAEQAAVLTAAKERSLSLASYEQLKRWLASPPSDELIACWREHFRRAGDLIDPPARERLVDEIVEQARAVASAAGRLLGVGDPICDAEQQVLDSLREELDAGER
ncbi:MAG: hypothetical protein QGG36_11785 [Pirellulaceae bacterium]|nr:hypothetical protein [Pirellulaceae bacterium]MDP7016475.1 hypothetical protein [Pirellulaceae bacterium]